MQESYNANEINPLELIRRQLYELAVELDHAPSDETCIEIREKMLDLQAQLNKGLNQEAGQILADEGHTPEGVSFRDRIGELFKIARDKAKFTFAGGGILFVGAGATETYLRLQARDVMDKFDVSKANELLGQADIANLAMTTGLTVTMVSAILMIYKFVFITSRFS